MAWAVSRPEKRRVLALLDVSAEITPESCAAAHKTMAGVAGLLEEIRADGPMRKTPMGFVVAIINSIAESNRDDGSGSKPRQETLQGRLRSSLASCGLISARVSMAD